MKLTKKTLKIRELNDHFRKHLYNSNLGKTYLTALVNSLPIEDRKALINKVIIFNNFTKGGNPYGEHDLGVINLKNEKYYFKIDYYNKNLEFHSEDEADPSKTIRVLTIMNIEEY